MAWNNSRPELLDSEPGGLLTSQGTFLLYSSALVLLLLGPQGQRGVS